MTESPFDDPESTLPEPVATAPATLATAESSPAPRRQQLSSQRAKGAAMAATALLFLGVAHPQMVWLFLNLVEGLLAGASLAFLLLGVPMAFTRVPSARRRVRNLRALCPECLRVESFRFYCDQCLRVVPGACQSTAQPSRGNCPFFRSQALPQDYPTRSTFVCQCKGCHHRVPPEVVRRTLGLVGTLSVSDYRRLYTTRIADGSNNAQLQPKGMGLVRHFTWMEEDRLACVLCLADVPESASGLPRSHAARQPDVLWLGELSHDPLVLAQALDAYARNSGLDPRVPAPFPVCLEAEEVSPHLKFLLERRFAEVRSGVSAAAVLASPPRQLADPVDRWLAGPHGRRKRPRLV